MNKKAKWFRPQVDATLKNRLHAAAITANLELREYLTKKLGELLQKEMPTT